MGEAGPCARGRSPSPSPVRAAAVSGVPRGSGGSSSAGPSGGRPGRGPRRAGEQAVAREGRPRAEQTMAEVLDERRWKGEREGGRLERKEEKEQTGEDKNIQGDFCKYLPLWQHAACHVGFGRLCGALGISDETLNRV